MLNMFDAITKIPRPSHHEDKIADFLEEFALERGLKTIRDEHSNLIVTAPGSPGREGEEPIILQAHMDMVCEHNPDVEWDWQNNGVEYYRDGDWLMARGTTLGADDGIGVAMILKILDDKSISHPPLECIFTVEEEVGLLGAGNIDLSSLSSRRLINLDSEEEGYFITGCAGGGNAIINYSGNKKISVGGMVADITVDGLVGGHSGADIHKNHANANVILGEILWKIIKEVPINLISVNGGLRDNAIPRNSTAKIVFNEKDIRIIRKITDDVAYEIKAKYFATDPAMSIAISKPLNSSAIADKLYALNDDNSIELIKIITHVPSGVIAMTRNFPDLVETSLNLGVIKTTCENITLTYHIRSSKADQFKLLKDHISGILDEIDGEMENLNYSYENEYPAWEYLPDSLLTKTVIKTYRDLYGKEPKVTIIHAGLECGILSKKLPGLDAISMGPDMKGVHSPSERLSVSSAERTMELLIKILEAL